MRSDDLGCQHMDEIGVFSLSFYFDEVKTVFFVGVVHCDLACFGKERSRWIRGSIRNQCDY